jgi:undecaprenyl pyrophosphate phosphatase UppP
MKFLEKFSTWIFVAYRGLLGIFLLFALGAGWLV